MTLSALGRITGPFLDFTRIYEQMSGIFVPCICQEKQTF